MRLKNKRESVPGGFYYKVPEDDHIERGLGSLDKLCRQVNAYYVQNKMPVPLDLCDVIEDQICSRLPSSYCWYKGIGDRISQVIHSGAKALDKVTGMRFEKKARECSSCGKRRQRLNALQQRLVN